MQSKQTARIDKIKELAKLNGGMITTAQIENCGINRVMIRGLMEDGILTREAHGIYYYAEELPDDLQILQKRSPKLIFSYGTALYLWDMSDRTPHIWDITVPQGFNGSRIIKNNPNIRLHYISTDKWSVGITETKTPDGNTVRLYDKERCIVDLVKRKDRIDKQLYLQSLREYFSSKETDTNKLLKYAKIFHVETPVRDYVEILTN